MYTILIVDDEMSAVEAIHMTLVSDCEEIGSVFMATSGQEALTIFEQESIDIVITDIRMPGMSGLELIEVIRAKRESVECIILSGYADFSYAQNALRNNISHYLLKPIRDEELIEVVNSTVDVLDKKNKEKDLYQTAKQTIDENMTVLRSMFLQDVLQGKYFTPQEMHDKFTMLQLDFNMNDSFTLLLIRMEDGFHHYDYSYDTLIPFSILNIATEIFSEQFYMWSCQESHEYLAVVLSPKKSKKTTNEELSLENLAMLFQQTVTKFLKGKVSVLLSSRGTLPNDLVPLYQKCISAYSKDIGEERDVFNIVVEKDPEVVKPLTHLYEPPSLIHLLESGRWDVAKQKIQRIFLEVLEEKLNGEHLYEVFYAISNSFISFSHKNGKLLESIIGKEMKRITQMQSFEAVEEFQDWSLTIIDLFREDFEGGIKSHRSSVVQQVQQFVEAHLAEDVSLTNISEHVHLHPVYLSKIYKSETGESITDYIHRFRMDKAAYLLTNTDHKIYEIAVRLGFTNTSYFIKVFKKYLNVTPQEYRSSGCCR